MEQQRSSSRGKRTCTAVMTSAEERLIHASRGSPASAMLNGGSRAPCDASPFSFLKNRGTTASSACSCGSCKTRRSTSNAGSCTKNLIANRSCTCLAASHPAVGNRSAKSRPSHAAHSHTRHTQACAALPPTTPLEYRAVGARQIHTTQSTCMQCPGDHMHASVRASGTADVRSCCMRGTKRGERSVGMHAFHECAARGAAEKRWRFMRACEERGGAASSTCDRKGRDASCTTPWEPTVKGSSSSR
jgi:hypothetical protein